MAASEDRQCPGIWQTWSGILALVSEPQAAVEGFKQCFKSLLWLLGFEWLRDG